MYQLIRSLTLSQLLSRQAPTLVASFLIAELFYKFHSFMLECGAFLLTWLVLDAVAEVVAARWKAGRDAEPELAQ
jgi:hypothetical protein